MKKRIIISLFFSAILIVSAYVSTAHAASFKFLLGPLVPACGKDNICNICDIFKLIENVLNFIYTMTSIVATLTLAWGGFLMIMPYLGGGQAAAERGKKIIKGSLIAILIIFFAWLGIDTIIKIVGQNGGLIPKEVNQGKFGVNIDLGPWNEIVCVAPKIEVPEEKKGGSGGGEPPDPKVGQMCDRNPTVPEIESCSTATLGSCSGFRQRYCRCESFIDGICTNGKYLPVTKCELDPTKGPCDPKKPKLDGKLGNYDGYDKDTLDKQLAQDPEGNGLKTGDPEKTVCNLGALKNYADTINDASREHGVDSRRIQATIMTESGGRPDAQSNDNDGRSSYGLMQIRPETARQYDLALTSDADAIDKLKDPYYNIWLGTKYYSDLQKKYKGNKDLASAAYNGGPAANNDSVDCLGKRRWQCEWDNKAHTLRNERSGHPGYGITRRYVPKLNILEDKITNNQCI